MPALPDTFAGARGHGLKKLQITCGIWLLRPFWPNTNDSKQLRVVGELQEYACIERSQRLLFASAGPVRPVRRIIEANQQCMIQPEQALDGVRLGAMQSAQLSGYDFQQAERQNNRLHPRLSTAGRAQVSAEHRRG